MIDTPAIVIEALKAGCYRKNLIVNVLESKDGSNDAFSFDNDNIVYESFSMDERMCSSDKLKFGLCEGTSVEFKYFDLPNITGRKINVSISAEYKDVDGTMKWHTIPLGYYMVDSCSRQASTGIIKCKAFNKLLSDYLDEPYGENKANQIAPSTPGGKVGIFSFIGSLLGQYSIEYKENWYKGFEECDFSKAKYLSARTCSLTVKYPTGAKASYSGVKFRSYFNEISVDPNKIYTVKKESLKPILDAWQAVYDFVYTYCENPKTVMKDLNNKADLGAGCGVCFVCDDAEVYYTPEGIGTQWDTGRPTMKYEFIDGLYSFKGAKKIRIAIPHLIETSDRILLNTLIDGSLLKDVEISVRENVEGIEGLEIDVDTAREMFAKCTARDIQSAVYEQQAKFGRIDRETDYFSGLTLNGSRLTPSNSLKPSETLYPYGSTEATNSSMYQKLWADEGNVRSFRNINITYKGTVVDDNGNETEEDIVYTVNINKNGTDDYDVDDNWLFKNLLWDDAQIVKYADEMVQKLKNVRWFPFEMWCAGLPYLETGDEIEINTSGGSYTSYILQRNLKGIQDLQDDFINGELDIF